MLRGGDVEFAVEDRVARGIFVHVGGAVADPLAGHENGELHVQLDLAHLEGRGMPVAHQVADEAGVVAGGLRALAVGDAGGLHDGRVVAHVVDDPDQPVVEYRDGVEEPGLHAGRDGAQGLGRIGAALGDPGLLFLGERHMLILRPGGGEGFAATRYSILTDGSPKMKTKYLHTMVRVKDLDASLAFWKLLGLEETRRIDNDKGRFTLVFLAPPGQPECPVELTYNWDGDEGLPSDSRHFGHLAYEVENIYDMCDHLAKNGVTINRPPRDGHMAFVRSPDNISIELLQMGEALAPAEPWKSMGNTGHW